MKTVRATGLDHFLVSTPQQRGQGFGPRLANAFEDIFALGYEHVIAIGNDSPGLSPAAILHAAEALQSGQTVLGPATDGGVYLIGLSQSRWNRPAFLAIPWETPAVQQAWTTYPVPAQGAIEWLDPENDIDGQQDLAHFLRKNPNSSLQRVLRSILASGFPLRSAYRFSPTPSISCAGRQLRGPPAGW